ncbi:MAG TPA: hypothetical protein VGH19_06655 [Verrucomicrobiae bacterium]
MNHDISWLKKFFKKQQDLIASAPTTISAKLKEALNKQSGQMATVLAGMPADDKTESMTGEIALVICGGMAELLEQQNATLLGFDGEVDNRVKVVLAGRIDKGELIEKATHESLIEAAKKSGAAEEAGKQEIYGKNRQAIVLAGIAGTEDLAILGLPKEGFQTAVDTAKKRHGEIKALKVELPVAQMSRLLWGTEEAWGSQFELIKCAAGKPGNPFPAPKPGEGDKGAYPPM